MRKDHRLEALLGIRRRQNMDDNERQVKHRDRYTTRIIVASLYSNGSDKPHRRWFSGVREMALRCIPSNKWFLGQRQSDLKRHLGRFSHFATLVVVTITETNTDYYSVSTSALCMRAEA